jgi:hypothetical protein
MEKKFERRGGTRFYLKSSLRRIDENSEHDYSLETVNISVSGILFRSNLSMKEGELITLQFILPGEEEEEIVTKCRLLHVLETIPGKQYFIGGDFESTEGFDADRLINYFEERQLGK